MIEYGNLSFSVQEGYRCCCA